MTVGFESYDQQHAPVTTYVVHRKSVNHRIWKTVDNFTSTGTETDNIGTGLSFSAEGKTIVLVGNEESCFAPGQCFSTEDLTIDTYSMFSGRFRQAPEIYTGRVRASALSADGNSLVILANFPQFSDHADEDSTLVIYKRLGSKKRWRRVARTTIQPFIKGWFVPVLKLSHNGRRLTIAASKEEETATFTVRLPA